MCQKSRLTALSNANCSATKISLNHHELFGLDLPLPVLYSFRRCPYAIRARIALNYAGICCELREVQLKDKPEELLKVSRKATV
ncbi:MAG: hypothetical protein HKN85_05320, partial [Gammaproteobacteria bacterium]|nr:hypothetical protein [Gammaproteobacteria bacterium]